MDDVSPLWPSDQGITRRDSYREKRIVVTAVTDTTNSSVGGPRP